MTLDPAQEREEVRRTYPPFSRRDGVWWVFGLLVLLVSDRFFHVDGWAYALAVLGLVSWEVTKNRLRRNADRFAALRP